MRRALWFAAGFFLCLAIGVTAISTHDAVPTRNYFTGEPSGVLEVDCGPLWSGYSLAYAEDTPTRSACRDTVPRATIAVASLGIAIGCVTGPVIVRRRRRSTSSRRPPVGVGPCSSGSGL